MQQHSGAIAASQETSNSRFQPLLAHTCMEAAGAALARGCNASAASAMRLVAHTAPHGRFLIRSLMLSRPEPGDATAGLPDRNAMAHQDGLSLRVPC